MSKMIKTSWTQTFLMSVCNEKKHGGQKKNSLQA
jgi:hypothetical protein